MRVFNRYIVTLTLIAGLGILAGSAMRERQEVPSYEQGRAEVEKVRRFLSTWQLRGAEASSPGAPDRQWHREVQVAFERAHQEIATELESERLPETDPNGGHLIWPQLDARRERLHKDLAVYAPFFRGRADLIAVMRRELPEAIRNDPVIVEHARRYAEKLDASLRDFQQTQFEFEAAPPVEVSIGAAAYAVRQSQTDVVPKARREFLAHFMPIHLANVHLFRTHEEFARELASLLPDELKERWRLAAATELLTPHADASGLERILQRIEAFRAIADEVKATVGDLVDARAPVRASLVHRLASVQNSLMTETEIRKWWTMYFDGAIAALNETGNPPRLQPEWTDALTALTQHDAETREQIRQLLTPAHWEAVSR